MPIYEYECGACGDRHEIIQKFSDAPKRTCPTCAAPELKRLVTAAAFHLKGNGWYVTDFRDKDKKKGDGKDHEISTGDKQDGKDSAGKSAAKSTENSTGNSTKSSDTGKKSSDSKSTD